MYRKSVTPIVYRSIVDAILAALTTRPAGALLATPNVHIFVNDFTPTQNSVIGDFTEATFTGGATVALPTPSAAVWLDNITRGVLANVNFICTADPSPTQVIYGYYVTDTTNADLWIAERFADAVPIATAGDFLSLDWIFPEVLVRSTAQIEL